MAKQPRAKRRVIIKPPRRTLLQRLRGNFLAGIVLVGPVALTIYLAWTVITVIDRWIVPWVPGAYNPGTYLGSDVPGFGVIVFLVFTTIVGWLTKNFFGRQIVRMGESWVSRMPVIRSIYNALKQIAETILSQSQTSFKNACLVEYPRKGLWAIAFVSTTTKGEIPGRTGEPEMLSIFLPTTPNPTSGFLLFAPRSDVVLLDMSVEEAAKLVISAGLVVPPTKAEIKAGVAARRSEPAA
ncbi:DUF502 domain-containing protein [Pikeienuella sp. HZG-20]|uniref:DUF502 domain-containing protein n=1 Tax=Paludibacillus litoralis TaxID=3133267 RepID=UPI0030ED41E5